MKSTANARFAIKGWDEKPYSEGQGLPKLTRATVSKTGSFVLQRIGTFEGGQAKESYTVVAGSGTGELRTLRGEGTSAVGHGSEHPFTLTYEVA